MTTAVRPCKPILLLFFVHPPWSTRADSNGSLVVRLLCRKEQDGSCALVDFFPLSLSVVGSGERAGSTLAVRLSCGVGSERLATRLTQMIRRSYRL
ncbi:hypothetical protein QBC34DRAFT_130951 [Podospora aff. communis PSN243]|uniref:Secreted protein n=1 Tax=Podospora aff. communis PSN243 TaxID=3040156 RepID=A0AAV9GJK2_9PEZI|nr:hypothetical protein QBC34DRAFT_130951 [Podospora aff. communis PSN243]